MWRQLTEKDDKEIQLYHDTMVMMDKFYEQYDVDKYYRIIRRGDICWYYNDGDLHYFITLHWNHIRQQHKIIFVGFQGSDDPVAVSKIGFEKLREFMTENDITLYGGRPYVMDNELINKHHDEWMKEQETSVEANKETEILCRFEKLSSPTILMDV